MAKRSDFAQKLLDDLRLRKERMAASNRSNQSHHLPIDAYAYTKQTYRGSRNTKGNEIVSSRSGEMVSRRQGSGELMSNMQQVIPYGRKGQSQRSGNMSQALAFAFENGSGKLTRADFSYTNSIMGFLHQINKRGTMELGISSEIRGLSNLDRQLAASTLSLGQINEISKGAQKLNHILRACSNGLNMDTYSLQFAKELLQGAIDLEESLRVLMVTRQAHNKNRITLLEEEDQDDEDDDDRMRMGGMQLARPSQVVGMQSPITLTRNSKSNVKRSSTSSNQTDNKGRIPNVIAKLMGLDNLPVPEKVEMGSGGNGNGNTHKTSKHTATKTEVVVQDRIKALKGFDKASIKADKHIRSSARKSLTRETETYVQVIGRKQNHPDNREQKGTMKGRSTNDPVLNIKSSIQVEKEINGSIIQPEKRHSNKHTLSNDNNKSRNHVGVQKSYILSKFGPQEDQMLMMRPPKNSSKSPHQLINPQKKQPPSILMRNVAAVKSYDDPDLVRDGASNDTNETVKQVISNRKLGQISSPRDQKFERANGIKTLKDEKHIHKLASKKTKNTTRKQKVDQMLNGRKLDIVKQQEASDRASGNGAEQARVGVSNEPIAVAVPVRCQAHKEAELPPAPALFSSGGGGELHTQQQSANVLRCQDVKSVTINLQDQAVPGAADEGFKTGEVALQHKSTNGGIQGRANHSEVENQNICEISIQQPLTESENCLKWTLVMSQLFVNTAEALFRLNIPFSVLQGGRQDNHQDEGNKLILDCGYEVMKRKGIRQELRVHTCSFSPVLNIRSLDDLVRQLNEDMEKLQFYGRKRCAQVGVEDYLPKMLEHDVYDKYPDIDCMWDFGWNNEIFAFIEKYDVVRDTEKHILSVLLDEITKDCCMSTRIEYENHTLNGRISPDLKLAFFTLRQEEKYAALLYLIREHIASDQQTLIFVSTKHHVEFLNSLFRAEGIEPSVCYGDMDQDARKIHVSRFRARRTMLLIVTDIAARGIDIPLLDNVINWDFPPKPKIFVHRVGRAARAGRTGTAYSFVTSEDMAYLLDLHLFLSKPVRAAPTEEEVLRDMDGVMSRIDHAMANGETIYGRFPQKVIDLVSDRVREIIDTSAELESLQRTCKNAFRLYSKTKPLPSKESIRRVKDLPREGLHPIFSNVLGTGELMALAFSEHLKKFRPKQTILEAEGEAAKSKHPAGPSGQWADVMKRKRAIHENIINLVHEQHSKNNMEKEEIQSEITSSMEKGRKVSGSKRKPQSFKDDDYYISSIPKNHHMEAGLSVKANEDFSSNRLEAAVLDLVADDGAGMQKQRSMYHWDKKSKKYIKLNNGDRVAANGKIKTESGAKTKATKTGIYKKWKERSHSKISLKGTNADGVAQESSSLNGSYRGGRRNFRGSKKQHSMPNAHVRSEIKDMDQIRKERQKKANKISYMKSKSPKGKKTGRKGNKRRAK